MALDKIPTSADEVPKEPPVRRPNANAVNLDTAAKQDQFNIDDGRIPQTGIISFNPNVDDPSPGSVAVSSDAIAAPQNEFGHDYRHLHDACEEIGFEPDEPSTEAPVSQIHQMPISPEARLRRDALEFACSDLDCTCPETVLLALEEMIGEARDEEAALIEDERRIEERISRIEQEDEAARAARLHK